MRAIRSRPPPGGNVTTRRTGRWGNVSEAKAAEKGATLNTIVISREFIEIIFIRSNATLLGSIGGGFVKKHKYDINDIMI
jgi:hypothetical protein